VDLITELATNESLRHQVSLLYQSDGYGIYCIRDADSWTCGDGYGTGQEMCHFYDTTPLKFMQKTGLPYLHDGPPLWKSDMELLAFASSSHFKLNERFECQMFKDGFNAGINMALVHTEWQKFWTASKCT
jgi:hypothetical protein